MTNLAVMESGVGGQTANSTAQMFLASSIISSIMYSLLTQQIMMQKEVYTSFASATEKAIGDSAAEIRSDAKRALCSACITGTGAIIGGFIATRESFSGKESDKLTNIKEQKQFLKDHPIEENPETAVRKEGADQTKPKTKTQDELKKLTEKENIEENWDSKIVKKGDEWKYYEGKKFKIGTKKYSEINTHTNEEAQTKLDDLTEISKDKKLHENYKEALDIKENKLEHLLSERSARAWSQLNAAQMFVQAGNSTAEAVTSSIKADKETDRAKDEAEKTKVQSTTDLVNQSMSMSTKSADSANKIADSATTMVYDIMRNNAV